MQFLDLFYLFVFVWFAAAGGIPMRAQPAAGAIGVPGQAAAPAQARDG